MVPVTATRYCINALKLPTVINWYPWYDSGKVSFFTSERLFSNCSRDVGVSSCFFCNIGWRVEPSIQGADICNCKRIRTRGSSPSSKASFYSFQIIFGEQADAKIRSIIKFCTFSLMNKASKGQEDCSDHIWEKQKHSS